MSPPTSTTGVTARTGDEVAVRVLGHFGVVANGHRHELTHSEARLLALMCLRGGDIGREWLAGRLWGDVSTSTAMRRLRSTMSRLHRSVPGVLRRGRDDVGLSDAVRVDLHDARDRAHRLLHADAEPEPGIWSPEPFLDDVLVDWYDEWIEAERSEFRNLRVHALEAIAAHQLETGRFASSIELCLAVLRTEPFRETTHGLIIRSHLAEGNRTEAVAHAREYEALVRSELGMAPDIEWAFDAR
jgi:SARP family transcriptional regulator, regulator of embCAB operon